MIRLLVIRVNIWFVVLKHLEQTKHLEPYNTYEFDLDNEAIKELNCIFSKVYNY
jgi:hypothetical protein